VEMMPAMIAGVTGASSSWRGLYPAVVDMVFSCLERVRFLGWRCHCADLGWPLVQLHKCCKGIGIDLRKGGRKHSCCMVCRTPIPKSQSTAAGSMPSAFDCVRLP
jgi:hypothetical protein